MSKKYKKLFENLCCSHCKIDINEDFFRIIRKEKGLKVIEMKCPNCGKDYGIGFLKIHENVGQPNTSLKIQD